MRSKWLLLFSLILSKSHSTVAVQRVEFASGFQQPVAILDDPLAGRTRKFVVEQTGTVKIVDGSTGQIKGTFLDLTSKVSSTLNEGGLLGMAFHPDYSTNRFLFVHYTKDIGGKNVTVVIRRLRVGKNNPNSVPIGVDSKQQVLAIPKKYTNHNGGQILFGPFDNYLYIGTGDGGSGGDPDKNAQNRKSLLGKMLRIDVWTTENLTQAGYDIPSDNPYVGNQEGFKEEIFHYGLRNPWRFSFDKLNGDMYIGDVGQNRLEEIDYVKRNQSGVNFGWNLREGNECYRNTSLGLADCLQNDTIKVREPILVYSHSEGNSVTGGYRYRGPTVTGLNGKYIFADYAAGKIFTASKGRNGWSKKVLMDTNLFFSSFGEAKNGELFVLDYGNGIVFKLTS